MRTTKIATLLLFALLFAADLQAQSTQFKLELHNRGLELLRTLKDPDEYQFGNAFSSAAALDFENLVPPLIAEFKMKPMLIFENAVVNAVHFPDFELAFRSLRPNELTPNHCHLIGDFAEELGGRNGDLDRLLEALEGFLNKMAPEFEADKSLSPEELFAKRIEELRYVYQRGYLEENETSKPLDEFMHGIESPMLRDSLKTQWLESQKFEALSTSQIENTINGFSSSTTAEETLTELLNKLDDESLASESGNKAVRFLILLHAKNKKLSVDHSVFGFPTVLASETGDDKFVSGNGRDRKYRFEFTQRSVEFFFPRFVGVFAEWEVARIAKRANLFDSAPEFMEKHGLSLPPQTFEDAGLSLIVGGGQWIEHPSYDDTLIEGDFQSNLKRILPMRRPKWIINFVRRYGLQNRHIKPGDFPDEDKILKAFEACKADCANIGEQIARCMDNAGQSAASTELLYRMLSTLPKDQRPVTKHELDLLIESIQDANGSELDDLFDKAMKLVLKLDKAGPASAAHFAFAFARKGKQNALDSMLEKIEKAEDKAWMLFQCAMAFPPRSSETDKFWYRPPRAVHTGGVF